MTPIIQSGTHLISGNSRETTKCININGGLIEVVLVPRRGFQPLKWLTCDSVRRGSPQPGFAISYVTPEKMTTISHNSSEDVTSLTDEQALWAACVCVCLSDARLSYTCKDCLMMPFWPVLVGIQQIFVSDCVCLCARIYMCEVCTCTSK